VEFLFSCISLASTAKLEEDDLWRSFRREYIQEGMGKSKGVFDHQIFDSRDDFRFGAVLSLHITQRKVLHMKHMPI
jgi:hypothetical protein